MSKKRGQSCIPFTCVTDSCDKYDIRDVDRLLNDDALVDGYLDWRHYVLEDTLKMIDESLKWRKEFELNGGLSLFQEHSAIIRLIQNWLYHLQTSHVGYSKPS